MVHVGCRNSSASPLLGHVVAVGAIHLQYFIQPIIFFRIWLKPFKCVAQNNLQRSFRAKFFIAFQSFFAYPFLA
jgi:hypothetical protein